MSNVIVIGPNHEILKPAIDPADIIAAINASIDLQGARANEKYPFDPSFYTEVR
jgi:hypothetical protein